MTCRLACTIQQLSEQAMAWQVWPPNALFPDMQYTDEASHKPVRAVKGGIRQYRSWEDHHNARAEDSPMLEVGYICSDGPLMHVTRSFLQNMDVK